MSAYLARVIHQISARMVAGITALHQAYPDQLGLTAIHQVVLQNWADIDSEYPRTGKCGDERQITLEEILEDWLSAMNIFHCLEILEKESRAKSNNGPQIVLSYLSVGLTEGALLLNPAKMLLRYPCAEDKKKVNEEVQALAAAYSKYADFMRKNIDTEIERAFELLTLDPKAKLVLSRTMESILPALMKPATQSAALVTSDSVQDIKSSGIMNVARQTAVAPEKSQPNDRKVALAQYALALEAEEKKLDTDISNTLKRGVQLAQLKVAEQSIVTANPLVFYGLFKRYEAAHQRVWGIKEDEQGKKIQAGVDNEFKNFQKLRCLQTELHQQVQSLKPKARLPQ